MADAGSKRLDTDQNRVFIAVGSDALGEKAVARTFTFQPELLARTAIKGDVTGFDGLVKGFFVHEANHQDAARGLVLNDSGDKSVRFFEV